MDDANGYMMLCGSSECSSLFKCPISCSMSCVSAGNVQVRQSRSELINTVRGKSSSVHANVRVSAFGETASLMLCGLHQNSIAAA